MSSCHRGHEYITRKLVEAGADPNIQNKVGESAAMFAVKGGHLSCIDALAQSKNNNVDWNLVDKYGRNVTMLALDSSLEVLNRLTTIDTIDWNTRNSNGDSTLTLALASDNSDIIRTVLSVSQIKYDVDHLKEKNVYDKAVAECQKYLAELYGDGGNIDRLVSFALHTGMKDMAELLGKS